MQFRNHLSSRGIFAIMLFTLCIIGLWFYKFLFWLLAKIWHSF